LWKNADPDIPIYQQAKAEYAKLAKNQASFGRYRRESARKTDRRERPHAIPNLQNSQPGTAKEAQRPRRREGAVTSDSK